MTIRHLLKTAFLLCCLLLGFACSAQESEPNLNELTQQLEHIRQNHNVSAAVVLLVEKDRVLLNAHLGTSSWENEEPLSTDALFRIGSISKSFAGLLALRLQEKGLIDLDKPFSHYIKKPYITNTFKDTNISLAQLLEHSAGLGDMTKAEWDYNDPVPISLEQALDLKLGNHQTLWPPGLHSSYSNVGAGLFGLALEKASGKTYEALMHEFVFEPLGMHSSTLLLSPAVKKKLITGYNTNGKTTIPYWHNIYRPFAAINTDADDTIRFLQMLLDEGALKNATLKEQQFLSKASFERMENPQTTLSAQTGLEYGYGLGNYHWQKQGHTFHGHGGDADGYLAHYGYNRESGQAYFVMVNAFNKKPLRQMRELMEAFIIKDLAKPEYPARKKPDKSILQGYVGDYVEVTKRFGSLKGNEKTLKVFIKNKQLYTQEGRGSARVLYAVTPQHFRRSNQSVATVAFIEYQGKMYLQGDMGNFLRVAKIN